MKSYIIKRLLSTIPLLVGISFISFCLINFMPTDPAEAALRVNQTPTITQEMIKDMRHQLGLDQPFFYRYFKWVADGLQGNFGLSYSNQRPVLEQIRQAFPPTLMLAGVSLLIVLIISISAGVLCAVYQDGIFDRLARAIVFFATAMPNFWVGLLFIWLFSVKLNLLPTSGMDSGSSIILPAVTLSLLYISTYMRLIRNNMVANLNENYVLYARIRGIKEGTIIRHVFKNSLHSSLAALGMSIPRMIAGTVVVENIFAWPGLGRLCVEAIFNRDFPMIQAYVLQMAVLFVISNLVVDIVISIIDPRIRRGV